MATVTFLTDQGFMFIETVTPHKSTVYKFFAQDSRGNGKWFVVKMDADPLEVETHRFLGTRPTEIGAYVAPINLGVVDAKWGMPDSANRWMTEQGKSVKVMHELLDAPESAERELRAVVRRYIGAGYPNTERELATRRNTGVFPGRPGRRPLMFDFDSNVDRIHAIMRDEGVPATADEAQGRTRERALRARAVVNAQPGGWAGAVAAAVHSFHNRVPIRDRPSRRTTRASARAAAAAESPAAAAAAAAPPAAAAAAPPARRRRTAQDELDESEERHMRRRRAIDLTSSQENDDDEARPASSARQPRTLASDDEFAAGLVPSEITDYSSSSSGGGGNRLADDAADSGEQLLDDDRFAPAVPYNPSDPKLAAQAQRARLRAMLARPFVGFEIATPAELAEAGLFDKDVARFVHVDEERGNGVVASRYVPPGETVAVYHGAVVKHHNKRRVGTYSMGLPDYATNPLMRRGEMFSVDSNPLLTDVVAMGAYGGFVNDTRGTGRATNAYAVMEPVTIKGKTKYALVIKANNAGINAGEEALIDYGAGFWADAADDELSEMDDEERSLEGREAVLDTVRGQTPHAVMLRKQSLEYARTVSEFRAFQEARRKSGRVPLPPLKAPIEPAAEPYGAPYPEHIARNFVPREILRVEPSQWTRAGSGLWAYGEPGQVVIRKGQYIPFDMSDVSKEITHREAMALRHDPTGDKSSHIVPVIRQFTYRNNINVSPNAAALGSFANDHRSRLPPVWGLPGSGLPNLRKNMTIDRVTAMNGAAHYPVLVADYDIVADADGRVELLTDYGNDTFN